MINRSEAPQLATIDAIDFVAPQSHQISDNVTLFHMKEVPNETARFDLYFDAGKARDTKGLGSFVNGLLLTGTPSKSAIQINEEINALGGFFESGLSAENAVISMYCLRENLVPLFEIVINAVMEVAFHPEEVVDFLAERKQKMRISLEKVSYLAQSNFQQRLFASHSNYATILTDEHFENVTEERLKAFHEAFYLKGLERVVVVGDIDSSALNRIAELSKHLSATKLPIHADEIQNAPGELAVPKKGAVQSAIRIGRTLFNKNHPDYLDFLILNTILGDYFGSRLMSNIREDKGYTYGIGSMLAELQNTGYFMIATEVGSEVRDLAVAEIKNEIERLQTDLVLDSEINLVQNYMRGQLLKSADGPYAMTDLFLSAEMHGKSLEFYNDALKAINEITPERIRTLAQKYLNWNEMTIVTAG